MYRKTYSEIILVHVNEGKIARKKYKTVYFTMPFC